MAHLQDLKNHRILLLDQYESDYCECDRDHIYPHGELKTRCEECGEELHYVGTFFDEEYEPREGEIYAEEYPSGTLQCFICRDYHFDSGLDLTGDFNCEDHTIAIVQHPANEKWFMAICQKCRDEHQIFTKGIHAFIQPYAAES